MGYKGNVLKGQGDNMESVCQRAVTRMYHQEAIRKLGGRHTYVKLAESSQAVGRGLGDKA